MRTDQEMFNIVCDHLLTQNCKSKDDMFCLYRDGCGNKCAVGALIPDELYKSEMDPKTVISLLWAYPELKEYIPNLRMAEKLQLVHDVDQIEDWPKSLLIVANDYNLKLTPLLMERLNG